MPLFRTVSEAEATGKVKAVYDDIRGRQEDRLVICSKERSRIFGSIARR